MSDLLRVAVDVAVIILGAGAITLVVSVAVMFPNVNRWKR